MNVAIIGAGLAGLTAAYELRRLSEANGVADLRVDVYEATDRIGGKLYTCLLYTSDAADDIALV